MQYPLLETMRAGVADLVGAAQRRLIRMTTMSWMLRALEAGVSAGIIAGAAMPIIALLLALIGGGSPWAPPRAILGMFFGVEHAGEGFDFVTVALGSLIHVALSGVFGVFYGVAVGLTGRAPSLLGRLTSGLLWGIGRWVSNTFVIAPLLPAGDLIGESMPATVWFIDHLLYGTVLALVYHRWQRSLPRERDVEQS